MSYSYIEDVALISSLGKKNDDYISLLNIGYFENPQLWDEYSPVIEIEGLMDNINSRMKYSMSKLSLGIFNALDIGPSKNITPDDEIFFFSGFTEIETVNKIGNKIMIDDYAINPALFPNSVHHVSLCYFTILKKLNNYCATITDGPFTNLSFINFLKNRVKVNRDFVVTSGEELSEYYSYDSEVVLNISPAYIAYKVKPNNEKGFKFIGEFDNIEEVKKNTNYNKANFIFLDKKTFFEINKEKNKRYLTDYPLSKDNPVGISKRLARHCLLNIRDKGLIFEQTLDKF